MLLLPLSLEAGYIALKPDLTASDERYQIFSLLPATDHHHNSKQALFFFEIKPAYTRERPFERLLRLLYSRGIIHQVGDAAFSIKETPSCWGAARFNYVLPEEINYQIERITNLFNEKTNPFKLFPGEYEAFRLELLPAKNAGY